MNNYNARKCTCDIKNKQDNKTSRSSIIAIIINLQ